jgi:hypothetical protein
MVMDEGSQPRSRIRPDLVAPLLEFLSAARRPVVTSAADEAALTATIPE